MTTWSDSSNWSIPIFYFGTTKNQWDAVPVAPHGMAVQTSESAAIQDAYVEASIEGSGAHPILVVFNPEDLQPLLECGALVLGAEWEYHVRTYGAAAPLGSWEESVETHGQAGLYDFSAEYASRFLVKSLSA